MIHPSLLKPLTFTDPNLPPLKGNILIFMINRLQIGFILLILPTQLIYGHKYWMIVLAFCLSQLNLYLISKWLNASSIQLGNKPLLPKILLYPTVLIGMTLLFFKLSVILTGYTKVIQMYMLTEQALGIILIVFFAVVAYSTSKGAHHIARFSLLAFIFSGWMLFAYLPFFFEPNVSIREFFPLIGPIQLSDDLHRFFYVLSAFSGPEILLFLKREIQPCKKIYRYLTYGSSLTLLEISLLFILTVLFFGSEYLQKVEYPIVTMARYVRTPIIDRLEMFMIPFFLFPLIYSLSLVNLYLFRGAQFIFKRKENLISYLLFIVIIGIILLFIQRTYWIESNQEKIWLNFYVYLSGALYTVLPLGFMLMKWVKTR
jgi:hypothetical protein